jgi:RNA-directed DNA polymerase
MEPLPTPLFISRGIRAGHDPALLVRAGKIRDAISSRGGTPVLTLKDLALKTETSYGYLRKIVERKLDPYESIIRVKKDGTQRHISSPDAPLLQVQRWMLDNMLPGTLQHDRSFAYRRGRSIVDCASVHIGSTSLVKMDLHNFFGEIHERRAYDVFKGLGYPPLLSFEAARLCTRIPRGADHDWNEQRGVDSYGISTAGVLPQGAPTSGAIANATATALDETLNTIAPEYGYFYTRYSDDLTFSTPNAFSRSVAEKLIARVSRAIFQSGFKLHLSKTRVVPPGSRKIILGLLLGEDSVRLLPEFRRQLDNHARGVDKWGLVTHARHRGFDSALSLVNYVDGSIAFAKGVDRPWAEKFEQSWLAALRKDGLLD